MNHHRHFHWLHAGIALLLLLGTSGCFRSASPGMTPLPSLPPPTATLAVPPGMQTTATRTVRPSPTATAAADPSEETPTESPQPQLVTPTATLALASASSCEGAPQARLRIGAFAYVNPDPPLPNNLRSDAGQDNELIGDAQPGQAMSILEGPKCADGWLWWKVRLLDSDLEGWTAEGDAQGYWLVPCSSEEECAPQ